jgi:threonine dehydratase
MSEDTFTILSPDIITTAHQRIAPYIHRTPLVSSHLLNEWLGHQIFFKAEMLQKIGAFKSRGALNKLLALKEHNALPARVCAFSSGNHAQGLAYAAKLLGIECTIFFPKNVSAVKLQATKNYGASIELVNTRAEAESKAATMEQEQGALFVHAYSDDDIIAGQGTACLEALQDMTHHPDAIFAPCGGGGLTSGTFLAKSLLCPKAKLYAVEPALANDASQSYKAGSIVRFKDSPPTIADGVRTLAVSERTFHYLKKTDGFIEVSEDNILYWTQWLTHLLKLTTEPTAALTMAGAFQWLQLQTKPQIILVILSGGNIDAATQQTIWQHNQLDKRPFIA